MKEEVRLFKENYKRIDHYLRGFAGEGGVEDLCGLRGYFGTGVRDFLEDYGVFYIPEDFDSSELMTLDKEYGLFSSKGKFLFNNRYMVPIKDIEGDIIGYTGWGTGDVKYITTSSNLFKGNYLLFGMEQYPFDGVVVVEGVFDALHLRAIGIPAVAVLGSDMSYIQRAWLGLKDRFICVPDNDKVGRRVVKNDGWGVGRYLVWYGLKVEEVDSVKDVDMLCMLFESEDLRSIFSMVMNKKDAKVINIIR